MKEKDENARERIVHISNTKKLLQWTSILEHMIDCRSLRINHPYDILNTDKTQLKKQLLPRSNLYGRLFLLVCSKKDDTFLYLETI